MTVPEPTQAPAGADRELALSTMYFQRWADQRRLDPFFEAGRRMGFELFELSHILAPETVAAVDPRAVRLAAVHHPCPAAREPASLTSPDPETRDRAVAQLRRTLATARRLRAPAVVVHLGRIESGGDGRGERLRFELLSRYAAGMRTTDRYRTVLGELAALREEAEPACLDRAADGLAAVLHDARDSGVEIGLETGFDVLDLPTPEGMRRLMRDFGGNGLRAWLDTGHVGAIDNLGLASFAEWSAATGSRWLGAHCHDVVGLRDHLVPGAGQLDFATLAEHLPRKAIVTCEVDWYFTPEEVTAGAQHLRLALAVADP